MQDASSQSPTTAAQIIASQLTLAAHKGVADTEKGRLVRFETPIAGCVPLEWLRAQNGVTQYYWSDREGEFDMAGVGEADILSPDNLESPSLQCLFDTMRARLFQKPPSLRYYGGFRFHAGPVKGTRWIAFKEYRFVVPKFEVVRRARGTFFACNVLVTGDTETDAARFEAALERMRRLVFPETTPPLRLPRLLEREDTPDRDAWRDAVWAALDAMDRKELAKVVLARETVLTTSGKVDAASLLGELHLESRHAYEFCFHPAPDRAFIGVSPERLYKRINCYIQSEALAATAPRGRTDAEDRDKAEKLLASDKARREHAFVVRSVFDTFDRGCRVVDVEERPSVLRLRNCHHLRTGIAGLLNEEEVDATLLAALHPTPAVGGTPRDAALEWIAAREPFDRGIFAGPVGWVGYDAAEFCVGIRSGLVSGDEIAVYSGAGIVKGSDPMEEWDELENKMAPFRHALGAPRQS